MVSVVLLARRHLKWEEELQKNHYRFLEQNLQRTLWNCRACHLGILLDRQPKWREGFCKCIRLYEESWNDSDSITAVFAREMEILTTFQQHLHKKSQNRKHNDSRQPNTTFLRLQGSKQRDVLVRHRRA